MGGFYEAFIKPLEKELEQKDLEYRTQLQRKDAQLEQKDAQLEQKDAEILRLKKELAAAQA